MLGGMTPITTVFGSAPLPTASVPELRSFARAAASIGLHLLLIEPGGKKPVDVRTAYRRREDDKAAQQVAREMGQPNWDKVKSKGGVYLATDNTKLLDSYIEQYRKQYGDDAAVNFAVAVGPSKLVVVDCDTREQVDAFLADFGVDPRTPPTVRSPGQIDADGNWAHKDGGHFYFTSEVELPDYSGSLTAPGGYVYLWAGRYVLIPPSVRPEGAYTLLGQDFPAPAPMIEKIRSSAAAKMNRNLDALAGANVSSAIDTWALGVTWADILEPAMWTLAARGDTCGCDIWTAPGDHGSPKSATAHDTSCSLGRYTPDNAPLHIWTDNPGPELEAWMSEHGSKTLSRLQVVAALDHGGDVGAAMRALSVMPEQTEALAFGRDQDHALGVSKANLAEPLEFDPQIRTAGAGTIDLSPAPVTAAAPLPPGIPDTPVSADPFVIAGSVASVTESSPLTETPDERPLQGVPLVKPFAAWRDLPPPEFIVEGLIEDRGFVSIIGAPGIGKSGVALDIGACICMGKRWMGRKTTRQRVLYLPGEGLSGSVQRLRAWEAAHNLDIGEDFFIGDSIIQIAAHNDVWQGLVYQILENRITVIMIDTYARASVGLEENSATDVGRAIAKFDQVRKATNSTLIVVHHTAKASNAGRGSSALNGALDTEILITSGDYWWNDADGPCPGRPLSAFVSKQKNAAAPEDGIPMIALPFNDSFVMTGPSGLITDPLEGMVSPKTIVSEPMINVALRAHEFAQRFTAAGITRSDLAYGIEPDDWTARRKDAKTAWKIKVSEAVDLGLRYGLLDTTTGTMTGARIVPGTTTPEAARTQWTKDTMIE